MGDACARKTKTRLHILGHLSTVSDPGGSPPELFPECSTPDFGSSALLLDFIPVHEVEETLDTVPLALQAVPWQHALWQHAL